MTEETNQVATESPVSLVAQLRMELDTQTVIIQAQREQLALYAQALNQVVLNAPSKEPERFEDMLKHFPQAHNAWRMGQIALEALAKGEQS